MYFPRLFLCLQSAGIRCLDDLHSLRWVSFCPISFTCNSHQGYFFTLGNVLSFSASLGILGLGKRSPWSHLASISCFHCCLNSLVSNLLCGPRYETQPLLLESTILLPGGSGAGNCYRRAHAEHISIPKPFSCFLLEMPHCPGAYGTCCRPGWAVSPAHPGLSSLSLPTTEVCDCPHREEVDAWPVFLVLPDPFLEGLCSQLQPAQTSLPDKGYLGISPRLQ